MSADAGEDDAVLDVKVPTRRRRASDDEAEDSDFHDAAEYAASVADSQAVDQEGRGADEPRSGGDDDEDQGPIGEITGEEEVTEADGAAAEEDLADRRKAKLREPFEVPTSGAFWLHDDRFGGGEEPPAEPPRPGGAAERKARSDTEGRWMHDKFGSLELGGEAAEDDSSENAFSQFRRGRGRGGRRGGGRGGDFLGGGRGGDFLGGGRGRGISAGRGRGGRYDASHADGYASEHSETGGPPGLGDSLEALPQRQPRAPRPAASRSNTTFQTSSQDEDAAGAAPAGLGYPGRGRGQGIRGGRGGEFSGRGRGERSFSPEGGYREYGAAADYYGGGGRGRGAAGRGRGREDWSRGDAGMAPAGRGGYVNGGRGAGRGYDRGPDVYDGEAGDAGVAAYRNNGGAYEGGRGRGRDAGRSFGDVQARGYPARGLGPGRGPPGISAGRGPSPAQRQHPHQQQHPRKSEEDFPPLPGSTNNGGWLRPSVSLTLSADPPSGNGAEASHGGAAADAAAPATQGVRRYSKMAGKAGGGEGGGGGAAAGSEAGRVRGEGREGAPRASKLSAAAPTFEPTPAAPTDRQQPVHSVPLAYGAPLQPMTVITSTQQQPPPPPPPVQPMGVAPEPYGAGAPPHGQSAPYVLQQHPPQQQPPPPPPQAAQGGQLQGYAPPPQGTAMPPPHHHQGGMPPPPQGGMMGSPMAPQGMQQQQQPQYGAGGGGGGGGGGGVYNTSFTDMEAWYQDAYQKALATGMDPQQAYSAVQGYVQGMQMAYQTMAAQQRGGGGYPTVPPMMQGGAPQGP